MLSRFKKPKLNEDEDKAFPLHIASYHGHLIEVECLLKHEILDINEKDRRGDTALHVACCRGHLEIIKCLLGCEGIDLNAKDTHGNTVLHFASSCGWLRLFKCLLRCDGININAKNNDGSTPLHIASKRRSLEIVKCLLECEGININVENTCDGDVLNVAPRHGQLTIFECFDKEINIDHIYRAGHTSLYIASRSGYLDIAKCLVRRGAEVDIENLQKIRNKCSTTVIEEWKQYLPSWNPRTHKRFPSDLKKVIFYWCLVCKRMNSIIKKNIPKDIRLLIIKYIVHAHEFSSTTINL